MTKVMQITAIYSTMNCLLKELNMQLINEGYDLIGVCSEDEDVKELGEEEFDIVNIDIDRSIRPLSNLKTIYKLYRLFKKERPDIVHVHTPIAAVLGRIAAKLARVPIVIYTAHGFYFHENMSALKYKIFLNIEKYIAKYFTDYIFTQSAEDRLTAIENRFIEQNKILAIGNGVDIWEKFNPINMDKKEIEELYREFNLKKEDKIVTFIGRLVKEKGILDLLEAFDSLEDDNVKLLIVGDITQGSRDTATKEVIKKYEGNSNIICTGFRSDINNILHMTDIFCLPSYREGMPRSIIEAMAMGCTVIATDIRGSREEVVDGETGFLVPIDSPTIILEKLKLLLNNEKMLEDMARNGRERVEMHFDERKVIDRQLEIYNQLLLGR
ncbi:glycosyltransferase family 4 protein [Wukongibacter baidiensis]|uniref:glycosyltransferase family 4 protein n=1 Tax=Wukongibacter baidiensis TaxID=1723361 RepID=UPI003D7F6058